MITLFKLEICYTHGSRNRYVSSLSRALYAEYGSMSLNARCLTSTIMAWSLVRATRQLFREIVIAILLRMTTCVPIAIVMSKRLLMNWKFYHKLTWRNYTQTIKWGDSKLCLLRESPLQSSLSVPQQNFDQEWNSGRQIIGTDHGMIEQSLSGALMQGRWVKTQFWFYVNFCSFLVNDCHLDVSAVTILILICCGGLGHLEQYCIKTNEAWIAFYIRYNYIYLVLSNACIFQSVWISKKYDKIFISFNCFNEYRLTLNSQLYVASFRKKVSSFDSFFI